jgi:hypothetical protein
VIEKITKSEKGKRKNLARRWHVCATHKKKKKRIGTGTFVSSA